MICPCCGRPNLAPRVDRPGKHIDLTTGIAPIAEWGSACARGFVSDSRFGSGPVIKRTNRDVTRKWIRLGGATSVKEAADDAKL